MYLSDESLYNERLNREGKAVFQGSKFEASNSINQQRMYLKMAEEIKEKYPNINVVNIANDRDLDVVKKEIREIIGF